MLEEYGKYESVQGKKVHLSTAIDQEQMVTYYGSELFKILGIQTPWWEDREEYLKEEKIIGGLTDDLLMPSGHWHQRSGTCVWGNTPMPTHSEKYNAFLAKFNIEI